MKAIARFTIALLLTQILRINKAGRGRNIIFGRISIERNQQFPSKPNAPNCAHPGCKGAKDVPPQQDDLKKASVGEVTKSQAHTLYSLDQGAANGASEADYKPYWINGCIQG